MEFDSLDYKQNLAMPSTYHSHFMELQLQKIFERIYSTNSLYHRNYKNKIKQNFIQLKYRCQQKWLQLHFHDGSSPPNTPLSNSLTALHFRISIFPNKTPFNFLFILFFYFSLTNHTMSTTSFCKTITIRKSDLFMITFHTRGIKGYLGKKSCKHSLLHIQKVIQTKN